MFASKQIKGGGAPEGANRMGRTTRTDALEIFFAAKCRRGDFSRHSIAHCKDSQRSKDSQRPSWPGLSRPSTSFGGPQSKAWMPGTRPGMTDE
jgi:hypothetical protein